MLVESELRVPLSPPDLFLGGFGISIAHQRSALKAPALSLIRSIYTESLSVVVVLSFRFRTRM